MLPDILQQRLERLADGIPLQQLQADAELISRRYRGERTAGQHLLTEERQALAYALTRMPATFGAAEAALQWSLACTGLRPRSLLDVGSGTGAAVWACDGLLQLEQITCLEREPAMRNIAMRLMRDIPGPLSGTRWLAGELSAAPLPDRADLVTETYVLNELIEADRLRAVESLWNAAGQMLLLVEPGTPDSWRMMMNLRRHLISLGAQPAAPCACAGPCPIGGGDWCQFNARIQRSRLHRLLKGGDAPYEDEKFTYLAFVRQDSRPVRARVLRHPQIQKGRIGLTLCTESGVISRTVGKKEGELYRLARKCAAGDGLDITE